MLRPRDFPLRIVDVEAAPALLAVAKVEVALAAGASRATATLTETAPRAALALPQSAADAVLSGTLVSRAGAARIPLPSRPAGDWRIELLDVPGYGPRTMDIEVVLPDGVALRAIDMLADDAASEEQRHDDNRP